MFLKFLERPAMCDDFLKFKSIDVKTAFPIFCPLGTPLEKKCAKSWYQFKVRHSA